MSAQLALNIQLKDTATFDNFFAGENEALLNALREGTETSFYFWSATGDGKTHLLQALCHEAVNRHIQPAYIPLNTPEFTPAILDGLEHFDLVCLDDIQSVIGNDDWEQALFHLYNRIQEQGHRLIISANTAPANLDVRLPDLLSRLSWGLVYQLQSLNDEQKQQVLQQSAQARGMMLNDEVAVYLLKHCPRDMNSLFMLLEKLDRASLQAQRKLTIPFVRQYI
ncbi:MAG: DnaA regulatory inactivator Hda [Gammaproteobacteria bacterium]|nr:DnaA regulatory inactivator Hda [Gammaproteobacteria bacterium]